MAALFANSFVISVSVKCSGSREVMQLLQALIEVGETTRSRWRVDAKTGASIIFTAWPQHLEYQCFLWNNDTDMTFRITDEMWETGRLDRVLAWLAVNAPGLITADVWEINRHETDRFSDPELYAHNATKQYVPMFENTRSYLLPDKMDEVYG